VRKPWARLFERRQSGIRRCGRSETLDLSTSKAVQVQAQIVASHRGGTRLVARATECEYEEIGRVLRSIARWLAPEVRAKGGCGASRVAGIQKVDGIAELLRIASTDALRVRDARSLWRR
jgi:hypothetical protein